MRSFSYTPGTGFSDEFLLYSSSWIQWIVLVRSFAYAPDASFSDEFLLHSSSWF